MHSPDHQTREEIRLGRTETSSAIERRAPRPFYSCDKKHGGKLTVLQNAKGCVNERKEGHNSFKS